MLGRLKKSKERKSKDLNWSKVVLIRRLDFGVVAKRRGILRVTGSLECFIMVSEMVAPSASKKLEMRKVRAHTFQLTTEGGT